MFEIIRARALARLSLSFLIRRKVKAGTGMGTYISYARCLFSYFTLNLLWKFRKKSIRH